MTSELQTAVMAACDGTPYAVTPTEKGFDVALDIVDARWHGVFRQYALRETYIHHVTVDEAHRTFTIMDDAAQLRRTDLGHGRYSFAVAARATRQRGTVKTWRFRRSFGVTDDPSKPLSIGSIGETAHFSFSSEESRALITGPAAQLGYAKRMDPVTRTGLVVGLIGASSVLLVPLGLVIRHLVG